MHFEYFLLLFISALQTRYHWVQLIFYRTQWIQQLCSWIFWLLLIHCVCIMLFNRLHSELRLEYFRTFITFAVAQICKFTNHLQIERSFSSRATIIPLFFLSSGFSSGFPYIYNVLDWRKPSLAMKTVMGTLLLAICVHVFLFWVYKIRVFVQRRLYQTKLILPTTAPPLRPSNSMDSKISMVFGEQNGCVNDAFKNSDEKVSS